MGNEYHESRRCRTDKGVEICHNVRVRRTKIEAPSIRLREYPRRQQIDGNADDCDCEDKTTSDVLRCDQTTHRYHPYKYGDDDQHDGVYRSSEDLRALKSVGPAFVRWAIR